MICGANATSMKLVALTMSAWEQSAFGLTGFSAWETGPATAEMSTVAGSRITTDQVISADAVCSTRTFASGSPALARLAERASTGTIALDRAPPIASSTIRLGTWLAVTYAVPRQPAPTVFANTTVRTRPRTRENAVSTATMSAPRAIPRATLPLPASLSSSSVSGRDGSARPAVSVCTAPCPLARRHRLLRTRYAFPVLLAGSSLGGAQPRRLTGRVGIELAAARACQLGGQVFADRDRLVPGRVVRRDAAGQALD